jgi:hypothetical protein
MGPAVWYFLLKPPLAHVVFHAKMRFHLEPDYSDSNGRAAYKLLAQNDNKTEIRFVMMQCVFCMCGVPTHLTLSSS